MKKLLLLSFFSICIFHFPFAQTVQCPLRISLLTCSPGEELYSTFGHTALRVTDSATGTDIIFNYGTFEFAPDFYARFIKGKLLYYLSVQPFSQFVLQYQAESRNIVEQQLLLNCADKQRLYEALQNNAREENRYYRYDFLFDNCTTRARDIVAANTADTVRFRNILPEDIPTFRDLIHTYLDLGGQYWSELGIDMLLGSRLDKKVTNQQAMFLPDYLMKGFDSAVLAGQPLVTPPEEIIKMPSPLNKRSLFRPSIIFSIFLVVAIILYLVTPTWSHKFLYVLDFVLFFVLGLAGLLILFMWFGTEHALCRDNFNLLWALPTHLPVAFFFHLKKQWINKYFVGVTIINLLLLLAWFILPQELNLSLIPLLLLVIFRSWLRSKKVNHAFKKTDQLQQ